MKQTRLLGFAVVAICVLLPGQASGQSIGQEILDADEVKLLPTGFIGTLGSTAFGRAVAIDSNVLVVGAPTEDRPAPVGILAGAVYVFEYDGTMWNQTQRLVAPDGAALDYFGSSVAVSLGSGDLDFLLVGTPWPDSEEGKVYAFRRENDGPWEYDRLLEFDGTNAGDHFGKSVDIDFFIPPNSQTDEPIFVALVGAPEDEEIPSQALQGSMSIFQYLGDGAGWIEPAVFYGENPAPGFLNDVHMGWSVAIAGPLMVAGAPVFDRIGAQFAGAAFLFSQGNQQPGGGFAYSYASRLEASAVNNERLGNSITADFPPAQAAVGAPFNSELGQSAGAVYIFDIMSHGLTRTEVQKLQASDGQAFDEFGTSVSMDGNLLAIGAPGVSGNGAIYIFEKGSAPNSWTETGRILPDIATPNDCDGGESVAVSATTAVSGCPFVSTDGGALVYMATGEIFTDGFESGNTTLWSSTVP